MSTKTVYQTDAQGWYLGETVADESPLEPGTWLLPAGAVEPAPPDPPEGKWPRWIDGAWTLDAPPAVPARQEDGFVTRASGKRVPLVVSRFQGRAALHLAGKLQLVEAILTSPQADPLQRLAWTDAGSFRRTSPTVLAMADVLGLNSDALDDLFISAASIEA